DEPVDVVHFDSFSNFRKRVQCVVGPSGTTKEKTSNGQPHVVLGR
ncbi:glyoxalase superfamily protein, partial [Marivita sp.]